MTTFGNRGDMTAYSESYVREDIFMQQARAYGVECGANDPSPAVGGLLQYCLLYTSPSPRD